MEWEKQDLKGVFLLKPKAFRDSRGSFSEVWREEWKKELGLSRDFIQENVAFSRDKGVLRGLHFQAPPKAQAKLVWVTQGSALDVIVDLRKASPSYGQSRSFLLNAEEQTRLYVPRGFAHGYVTLEANTVFCYKVDNYYSPQHEGGLRWDSPRLGVNWPEGEKFISEKDLVLAEFDDAFSSPFTMND